MRKLEIGTEKYTQVYATDEPGVGGACHQYEVISKPELEVTAKAIVGSIQFQNGPIKECGVNGVMNEDLIAILVDRLQGFQSGNYACRENAIAITKLEEALLWLRKRTMDRERRGVEGTSVV